jgi:hypothetical protein
MDNLHTDCMNELLRTLVISYIQHDSLVKNEKNTRCEKHL